MLIKFLVLLYRPSILYIFCLLLLLCGNEPQVYSQFNCKLYTIFFQHDAIQRVAGTCYYHILSPPQPQTKNINNSIRLWGFLFTFPSLLFLQFHFSVNCNYSSLTRSWRISQDTFDFFLFHFKTEKTVLALKIADQHALYRNLLEYVKLV